MTRTELERLQDKYIHIIKERKKNPNDKDIRKKLSAI